MQYTSMIYHLEIISEKIAKHVDWLLNNIIGVNISLANDVKLGVVNVGAVSK